MWCTSLVLFFILSRTLGAPLSNEVKSIHEFQKPVVLFSCPKGQECYASPRNCIDDCDAAFSMRPEANGTTTFNITMLSGLGYVGVLVKEQGQGIYEKGIICTFHQPRGIVARVNYPDPILILEFFESTEPEGNTDSHHTQCSTNIGVPMPRKSEFKLIAGKWESELIVDERLGIDVVPAVENARILSTTPKLNIPPPRRVPAVRASPSKEVDTEKTSEEIEIETPVEKTTTSTTAETAEKSKTKSKETNELKIVEYEDRIVLKYEDEDEDDLVEIVDSDETTPEPRKGGKEDEELERPRFREYEDEEDEHQ
ncbi:hypothetical protein ANCCAN_07269 [Ancylostoma caninum]|uniref:Uncharacterized protein n=1 Tax=Ancylostoma caninum TaxID=29170 RepID=A0A368GQJ0_ANCCA|nr:hypothetical protein ANCCAN_07269 [Ancylostoma caninum]